MQPVIDRLLASGEPSIRYRVCVGALGEDPDSPAIRQLRSEIRRSPWSPWVCWMSAVTDWRVATAGFRAGQSDVDFLVDVGDMEGRARAHAYFGLLDELEELLGSEVDLVMVAAVKNRFIARDIERTKQESYAA